MMTTPETRASVIGGAVQGMFVLIGIVLAACLASNALNQEIQKREMTAAIASFFGGLARAGAPDVADAEVRRELGEAAAKIAIYANPDTVRAFAVLANTSLFDDNVDCVITEAMHSLRSEFGANPADSEALWKLLSGSTVMERD